MKNVMRMSVLVFLLVTGFKVKAAEVIDIKVKDNQIILVELGKVEKGTVIILQDIMGTTLFKDSLVSSNGYRKSLDLEVIPRGVYFLHLETEKSILSSKIVKTAKGISIEGKSSGITFKPCFEVMEDKVLVFLSNLNESTISLEIYDAGGELLNTINNSGSILKKTLDFSKVPAGEYTINIKMENRTFRKKITVG